MNNLQLETEAEPLDLWKYDQNGEYSGWESDDYCEEDSGFDAEDYAEEDFSLTEPEFRGGGLRRFDVA